MHEYSLWLIEDNDVQRARALELLQASSHAQQLRITAFSGPADLKQKLASVQTPDILITDIGLGKEAPTGVELVEAFFEARKTRVIYATAYLNLVTSAYRTEHTYLLAKPVHLEQLELALDKAIDSLEQEARETLTFSYGSGVKKLATSQIMWLESSGHRVEIHALDGTRETYDSLRNLASKLPTSFIRTHKSYVANLAQAQELAQNELVMSDGSRIPVSRKYRRDVHDALMGYLGQRA